MRYTCNSSVRSRVWATDLSRPRGYSLYVSSLSFFFPATKAIPLYDPRRRSTLSFLLPRPQAHPLRKIFFKTNPRKRIGNNACFEYFIITLRAFTNRSLNLTARTTTRMLSSILQGMTFCYSTVENHIRNASSCTRGARRYRLSQRLTSFSCDPSSRPVSFGP